MEKFRKKRYARDLHSLGSIIFYALVTARALIGPFLIFFVQLAAGAAVLFIIWLLYRKFDTYTARALVLTICTSIFYEHIGFAIFAFVTMAGITASSIYLNESKKEAALGLLFGVLSFAVGYAVSLVLIQTHGITN